MAEKITDQVFKALQSPLSEEEIESLFRFGSKQKRRSILGHLQGYGKIRFNLFTRKYERT